MAGISDTRFYQTFYGILTDDFTTTFGDLSNYHYHLVKNYVSDAASCGSTTDWTSSVSVSGIDFIYPHRIKKTYFIEGVVEGQITLAANDAVSQVSDFRVQVIRLNGNNSVRTTVADTGVISVNDDGSVYAYAGSVNEEVVYPFWIDVQIPQEFGENDRIVLNVAWDVANQSTSPVDLSHWNWETTEDIKIIIPFVL